MGQPIIVVTLNYRLNIFAFGDCKGGEMNLALSDQRAALDFIRLHIRGFGGDPVAHTPSVEFNC
jgi:carboxylesterase type B